MKEINTTKTYCGQEYHLFQTVKHKISENNKPVHYEGVNELSDILYMREHEWIITSLDEGIELQDPNFRMKILYTPDQLMTQDITLTTKTIQNGIPVLGY